MTAPTPTAATPEELAARLAAISPAAANFAAEIVEIFAERDREQQAEIERLKEEVESRKDNARMWEDGCAAALSLKDDWQARATTAEAALSASQERERVMREALTVGAKWGVAAPCWDGAVAGGLRDWIAAGCAGPFPADMIKTLTIIDPEMAAALQPQETADVR